jgi:hypothetical protein
MEDRLGARFGEQVEVVLARFLSKICNFVSEVLEGGGPFLGVGGSDFRRDECVHQDAKVRDLLFGQDVYDDIAFGVECLFGSGAHGVFFWVKG